MAIDFGVYCYPRGSDMDPINFMKNHGTNYGFGPTQKVKILKV